jgi:hypothetical protein
VGLKWKNPAPKVPIGRGLERDESLRKKARMTHEKRELRGGRGREITHGGGDFTEFFRRDNEGWHRVKITIEGA